MSFADRLAIACRAKGLSNHALSKRVQVSSTAAWHWARGDTHPRPEKLQEIAFELGVDPDWLRNGEEGSGQTNAPQADEPALAVESILADAKSKAAAVMRVREERLRLELRLVL
ncbi:MAG TPA: helix-turn-helix domain-containing protein [Caulobacteraceae bacterium]|nr:helix-turn-helix domain-containing protein [Caulobacteraceae bacterium]